MRPAMFCVPMQILGGLDLKYGEQTENIRDLCLFVLNRLGRGTEADLRAALKVLRTLRNAFHGIREEAIQAERRGEIPPVEQTMESPGAIG